MIRSKFFIIFIPIISVYITYMLTLIFCKSFVEKRAELIINEGCVSMSNRINNIPIIIFQIVWPILLLLLGIAWYYDCRVMVKKKIYWILVLSFCFYIPFSLCFDVKKRFDLLSLITLSLITIILLFQNLKDKEYINFYLILPILIWFLLVIFSVLIKEN